MSFLSSFPWRRFFGDVWMRTLDADIFSRAAQVAFYFTFSLFPLLYFIVTILGMVLNSADDLRSELFIYLQRIMPVAVYELVYRTVDEIIKDSSTTKLAVGLAVALWSASAGVDGLRNALNAIYGLRERRSWFLTKVQALSLTAIMIILVAGILMIVFYGWITIQSGFETIGLSVKSTLLVSTIQWVSILLIMLFACELIYNVLPDLRVRRWTWLNAGSIVAIISWLILSTGFRTYLAFYNSYNRTYGSLGAVMIMMLWLYLTAFVLMLGGIINSSLSMLKDSEDQTAETIA